MNSIKKIQCSYCGNKKLSTRTEENYIHEPYGDITMVRDKIFTCDKCGEEISYTLNYTDEYEKAQKVSRDSSVIKILESFQEKKISFTDIENSLDLPVRTLSRWKHKLNYSKIGLTLLKIVKSYPWIILVAAKKFDKKVTEDIFKKAAMKKFNLVEKNVTTFVYSKKFKTNDETKTFEPGRNKVGYKIEPT